MQSDVRASGIVGDWKVMALEAGVWNETVTGRGGVTTAWRKEKNAARLQEEIEADQTRKESCYRSGKCRALETTPLVSSKLIIHEQPKERGRARDRPRPQYKRV